MVRKSVNLPITILIFVILFVPVISVYAGPGCKYLTGEPGLFPYETIDSGGIERNYILYVPPKYKSNRPTPLVPRNGGFPQKRDCQLCLEQRIPGILASS